jgi:hypothetical protein
MCMFQNVPYFETANYFCSVWGDSRVGSMQPNVTHDYVTLVTAPSSLCYFAYLHTPHLMFAPLSCARLSATQSLTHTHVLQNICYVFCVDFEMSYRFVN